MVRGNDMFIEIIEGEDSIVLNPEYISFIKKINGEQQRTCMILFKNGFISYIKGISYESIVNGLGINNGE